MSPPNGHILVQKKFPLKTKNSIKTSAGIKYIEKCPVETVVEIASKPSILKKKLSGSFSGTGYSAS